MIESHPKSHLGNGRLTEKNISMGLNRPTFHHLLLFLTLKREQLSCLSANTLFFFSFLMCKRSKLRYYNMHKKVNFGKCSSYHYNNNELITYRISCAPGKAGLCFFCSIEFNRTIVLCDEGFSWCVCASVCSSLSKK